MTKRNGKRFTNYYAVTRLINNKVLVNTVPEIDDSVFSNARFDIENTDVYQWFITDCDNHDVERITSMFEGVLFAYSDKLDSWVLCVDHFGTPWQGVEVEILDDSISDEYIEILEEGK